MRVPGHSKWTTGDHAYIIITHYDGNGSCNMKVNMYRLSSLCRPYLALRYSTSLFLDTWQRKSLPKNLHNIFYFHIFICQKNHGMIEDICHLWGRTWLIFILLQCWTQLICFLPANESSHKNLKSKHRHKHIHLTQIILFGLLKISSLTHSLFFDWSKESIH